MLKISQLLDRKRKKHGALVNGAKARRYGARDQGAMFFSYQKPQR
jgi:hypothetical protein